MSTPESITQSAKPSVLESLRRNRMGGVVVGLVLSLVLGVLLSLIAPAEPQLWFYVVIGLVIAGGVGITVRALSPQRSIADMIAAFVLTAIGVHVGAVAGTIGSADSAFVMVGAGVPLNDALLAALVMPAFSMGLLLAGLIAVVIVGWGKRA